MNNNDNKNKPILRRLLTNLLIFIIFFTCSFYIFSMYTIKNNNLHNIAQKAATEKYEKEKANKNSKLYRYNSDQFIEDIVAICTTEAEKGEFYLEIDKPFIVTDKTIKYVTDTTNLKVTDYYTVEDMKEYVEDDTIAYLQKIYGIELELELVNVILRW